MSRTWRPLRRGFTLIEVLVVILILAILMAVALPQYLASIALSERRTCRHNMWSITEAEQSFRARTPTHVYTTVMSDLVGDLGTTPYCPKAGLYSVTISNGSDKAENGAPVPAGSVIIHCSALGHGVYAPGIDSD